MDRIVTQCLPLVLVHEADYHALRNESPAGLLFFDDQPPYFPISGYGNSRAVAKVLISNYEVHKMLNCAMFVIYLHSSSIHLPQIDTIGSTVFQVKNSFHR